jgi:hypothetical protein
VPWFLVITYNHTTLIANKRCNKYLQAKPTQKEMVSMILGQTPTNLNNFYLVVGHKYGKVHTM